MEINANFTSIQGALIGLQKSVGELQKIRYYGGNEDKISRVIDEIRKILVSNNYIKDNNKLNDEFDSEITNIVVFLLLNTNGCAQQQEEYLHLINIMPQLSKCLLANLVVALGLTEYFIRAVNEFPLIVVEQLLCEVSICLKDSDTHSTSIWKLLGLIIRKISALENTPKDLESAKEISVVASVLVQQLVRYQGSKSVRGEAANVHKGYSTLRVLQLLLVCDVKNMMLQNIISKLLSALHALMMSVTLEVFCTWAEINHDEDDQVLQSVIGGCAYAFIEKYRDFGPAKDLITMLASVAQRPKTIIEQIHTADLPTIISKIEKQDAHQKQWFAALLNTQIFRNKDAMRCVDTWAHLCTMEDVSLILNASTRAADVEAKNLAIKCASTLDLEDLKIVSLRYLVGNGISNGLNENPQPQLILLLNKLKDSLATESNITKQILLLLLQNPQIVLGCIFAECLKSGFYSTCLKRVFPHLQGVATVASVGLNALLKEINSNPPCETNVKEYGILLNILVEVKFFSIETVILEVIVPTCQSWLQAEKYKELKYGFEVLNSMEENVCFKKETEPLFVFLFEVMAKCRCKLLDFNSVRQEIVKEVIDMINRYCDANHNLFYTVETIELDQGDHYETFYKTKLFRDRSCNLLAFFYPNCDLSNHAEVVTYLIKIMPSCVKQEWKSVTANLCDSCGVVETGDLLTDFMVLVCQVVRTQGTVTAEGNSMTNALKYLVHNFGIAVKESIQPRIQHLAEDVSLTKNVCRLLKDLPMQLKCEDGLSLASILSDRSLRALKPDKNFACLLASINESNICRMLAQKILS